MSPASIPAHCPRPRAALPQRVMALLVPALLVAGLAGCGGDAPGPGAAGSMAGLQRVDLGLAPTDRIEAFDLAVTPSGTAALAGVARGTGAGAPPRTFTVFRPGGPGTPWGPPELLPGLEPPLRLAARGDTLHLVAGPHLRHWLRAPGAAGWSEDTVLGLLPDLRAETLDILPRADGLLLATAARVSGGGPAGADPAPSELCVLNWPRRADRPPHLLKDYLDTPDAPAGPALAARGDRLGLLLAVNEFGTRTVSEGGHTSQVAESHTTLHFFASADGGDTWSGPDALPEDPPLSGRGPAAAAPATSVALVGGPEGWSAFHTAAGLFAARTEGGPPEGGTWSLPRPVAPYRPGLAGGTGAWSVAARATPDGVRLWWIDERNRRSDRKPWNPLGGFPWSDAPDWANNDVFTVTLGAGDPAPPGRGAESLTTSSPTRLTADLSRADHLRVAGDDGKLTLAWAGRARVGKQPDSAGEAPALFIQDPPR